MSFQLRLLVTSCSFIRGSLNLYELNIAMLPFAYDESIDAEEVLVTKEQTLPSTVK